MLGMGRVATALLPVLIGLLLVMLTAVPGNTQDARSSLDTTTDPLAAEDINILATSYPQALPNDGQSTAVIAIELSADDGPLAGEVVTAEVTEGDGLLEQVEAVTDEAGIAEFKFCSGLTPTAAMIEISTVSAGVATSLQIPLAAVTYLDLTLVTPEEYELYCTRQVSASVIYTLKLDAFPTQLAADGASLATVRARLSLTDGTAAPGVPLSAEIISGDGELDFEQTATDALGDFSFDFITGRTPGTVVIMVTEPSTGLCTAIDLLLVEAGPARVELFYLDPFAGTVAYEGAILPADGMASLPVVAKVTDLIGIPLAGIEVRLEILDEQNGWLDILDSVSDAAGHVEFNYIAGTFPGRVRLRAFIANGLETVTF